MNLIPLKEAAEYLGIEPGTLRKWVQAKRIPYYSLGRPKFKRAELDRFIERHRVAAVQRIRDFKPGARRKSA